MRIMRSVIAAALLVAAAVLARFAVAEEVPIGGHSPTRVQGRCNEAGGVYFPPGSHGVYACLNPDGSGIICGGVDGYAKTCSVFGPGVVTNRSHVPVRAQVEQAEKARLRKAGK
jgi:hypothetical protein